MARILGTAEGLSLFSTERTAALDMLAVFSFVLPQQRGILAKELQYVLVFSARSTAIPR